MEENACIVSNKDGNGWKFYSLLKFATLEFLSNDFQTFQSCALKLEKIKSFVAEPTRRWVFSDIFVKIIGLRATSVFMSTIKRGTFSIDFKATNRDNRQVTVKLSFGLNICFC